MKISMITDEISADPETAIELGVEWGIHDFELRGFYTERVPHLSAYQKQRLHDMLDEYQVHVLAISPGLFKIAYPPKRAPRTSLGWLDAAGYESWAGAQRLVQYHMNEVLPASLDFANEFGARMVLAFGFDRAGAPPDSAPEEVLDCLRQAAERASRAGLQLVIENEDGFWADTGARSAQMMRAIDHPSLGINWDPGNAFFAGDEPYPAGYEAVREWVRHVHFKDAVRDADGTLRYAVEGQVDWAGQLRALSTDGYDGFVSVETHVRPKVTAARNSLERLRAFVAAVPDSKN